MTESIDRYWQRAQRYLASQQPTAARISLESLLQRQPAHIPALLAMANIAQLEGRVRAAAGYALTAAGSLPDDGAAIIGVATALLRVGETVGARECLDHPSLAAAKDVATLAAMAGLRQQLGEHAVALDLYDRAAAAGMDTLDLRFERALELIYNGRMDEAEGELLTCLRVKPTFGRAALALSRLRKQTTERNHLDDLRQRLHAVASGTKDHAALEFALYKELEDTGSYDEAWAALTKGNAIMYGLGPIDSHYAWRLFDNLIKRCTPDLVAAEAIRHEGPQPIFVFGMPRSGTTLVDRILSNHSQVVSAGELDDFGLQLRWVANHRYTLDDVMLERLPQLDYAELGRRYLAQTQWRAQGARYFVDKLPRNWMVAGMIRRALPQARLLNLVRDPLDVCFSNYRALLGDKFQWSYDQDALAQHYLQYRKVMDHWHQAMPGQILDVPYGDLVRDPEATARRMFSFCGLEWEPGCVDLTRNKAAVATLSMSQVRENIHTRFFEEWRHYERQWQPMRQSLATVLGG